EPGGWNERCQGPWNEGELQVKIGNGYRYCRQSEPGSKSVEKLNEKHATDQQKIFQAALTDEEKQQAETGAQAINDKMRKKRNGAGEDESNFDEPEAEPDVEQHFDIIRASTVKPKAI